MHTSDNTPRFWRKSSRSFAGNECVEVAHLGSRVGLRDSTLRAAPGSPVLATSASQWGSFIAEVSGGAFAR